MDRDLPSMEQQPSGAALARDSLYIVDGGVSSAKGIESSICERRSSVHAHICIFHAVASKVLPTWKHASLLSAQDICPGPLAPR